MPEWYLLSVYGALRAVPSAVVGLYVAFYIIATTVSMTENNNATAKLRPPASYYGERTVHQLRTGYC